MGHSGSIKREPGGGSDPTRYSKLRAPAAVLSLILAGVALTGCNNVEAQPDQPRPSASATQYPGGEKSEDTHTDTDGYDEGDDGTTEDSPTQGEFESIPSGLTVDYPAFETWDKSEGPTPNDLKRDEAMRGGAEKRGQDRYTQREKSDEFFNTNGIKYHSRRWGEFGAGINVFGSDDNKDRTELVKADPERFARMLVDKERMVMALNQDDTDPRNQEVAENLVEAITIEDSPARDELRQRMEEARQGIISPEEAVMTDLKLLRYTEAVTYDKRFVIEYETTRYNKKVKVTQVFKKSNSGDLRLVGTAYTFDGEDEQTMINIPRDTGRMIEADQ